MGKGNTAIRQWLSNKERFASFVNGALFQGTQIFTADNLKKEDGQQGVVLKNADGKDITVERYRDITMTAQNDTSIIIIACENQEEIHYAMPIRNMLYDALSYVDQIHDIRKHHKSERQLKSSTEFLSGLKKDDLLIPTLTIVFYYGEARWDSHKDLHSLLGLDRKEYHILRRYIPNYTINLIDPREIEDLTCFEEDLQLVFGMLQYRKNKLQLTDYVKNNKEFFSDVDSETANAIHVLLGSEKLFQNVAKKESGGMDMCQALDDLYQDGVNEGIERGMQSKLLELVNKKLSKGLSVQEIADTLEESPEKIKELLTCK